MKFLCSETQAIISTELAEKVIKISDFLSLGLRSTAFPLILYSKPVDRLEYRCLCKQENIDKMKTFSLQEVELMISLSDHFPVCQVQKSKCIGPVSYFDVILFPSPDSPALLPTSCPVSAEGIVYEGRKNCHQHCLIKMLF